MESTELNKILALVSNFAVLDGGKLRVQNTTPCNLLSETRKRLKRTEECVELLFTHGVSTVEYYSPFDDELVRAQKGSTLSPAELLKMEK